MVTIKSFTKRQTKDGRDFLTMELVGGIEMVQSSTTGKFYATVRKCSVPTTFDESISDGLVGTSLPGEIVRVESDPYEYVSPSTGEVVILHHSYAYQPSSSKEMVREHRDLVEA